MEHLKRNPNYISVCRVWRLQYKNTSFCSNLFVSKYLQASFRASAENVKSVRRRSVSCRRIFRYPEILLQSCVLSYSLFPSQLGHR